MHDLEKQLKEAFGTIHAEGSLKDSAMKRIRQERSKGETHGFSQWVRMAAAAACMLLLFVSGYGTRLFLEPVSVISIDINPSIELGINTFDRVVSADAYNDDGEELLQSLDLRFRKWEDAVEQVMESDTVRELLSREEELTLTVVGQDENENAALCASLREYADGKTDLAHCYSVSSKAVAPAHHCGLSYGKYLAYLAALEENENLTPEDVQNMTMKQIRELAGSHSHHRSWTEETTPPSEETTIPTECSTSSTHGSHDSHGKNKHKNGHYR